MSVSNSFSLEKTVVSANILCFGSAQTIIFALLPLLQEKTSLPISSLVVCLSLGTLFFIPGTLFWAHRSDEGKTFQSLLLNVFFLSLSMLTVLLLFSFKFSALTSLLIFLLGRIIWGLGASGIPGLSQKLQLERNNKKIEGITQNSLFLNLGRAVGPAFLLLGPSAHHSLIIFVSVSVTVFFLNFFLKASPTQAGKSTAKNYRISSINLLPPVILTFVMTLVTGLVHSGLGNHVRKIFSLSGEGATSQTAILLTSGSVFLVLGFLCVRKVSDEKWRKLIITGIILMTAGLLALAISKTYVALLLSVAVISFSVSFIHSGAVMKMDYLSGDNSKAKSLGVLQIASTSGSAFGGIILSFTPGHFEFALVAIAFLFLYTGYKSLSSLQLKEALWKA